MMRPTPPRLLLGTPALLSVMAFLAAFAGSTPAKAYPWMLRHGYAGCSTCHGDPSGGEVLTPYGRALGQLLLPMRYDGEGSSAEPPATSEGSLDSMGSFDDTDASEADATKGKASEPEIAAAGAEPNAGFLWGLWNAPDWLLLGGSMRLASTNSGGTRVFPMQLDLYGQLEVWQLRAGGSVGIARVKENSANARPAFVTTNQGNEFNLMSRSHWIGFAAGAEDTLLVRAGRLNLPFGVRIPEHFLWIREATRTDRDSDQQHGVAIAYDGSTLRGEVMGIAGNYQIPDRYRERGYSAYLEANVAEATAVGASSLVTVADADRVSLEQYETTRGSHGLFTRMRIAVPVALLAEADLLHTSRRELGYTGFVQGDWEVLQGLHGMATVEVLDQGYRENAGSDVEVARHPSFGRPALGGWLSAEWWFLPQVDLRFDVILRQTSGTTWLGQLHAYL